MLCMLTLGARCSQVAAGVVIILTLNLELYLAGQRDDSPPVIVTVHGGAWAAEVGGGPVDRSAGAPSVCTHSTNFGHFVTRRRKEET